MKWETPPPRGPKWLPELKSNPGEWARIADYLPEQHSAASMRASLIRRGVSACYQPAGSFEAEARKTGDGWAVYARYLGEESQ